MEKSEGKNMEYMEGMDFINSYLEEDEYVLWRGKPGKKNRFSSIDKVMFPFALFWTAFALLLEGSVIMSEAPLIYCVFGVPFVLIGIFLLYSSFFSNVFAKGKTIYVVTNKKLMIKVDNDIEIYMPDELPPMKIKLYKNGNGTIIFSRETHSRRQSTYYTCCMLEDLPDVAQAQNAINIMKGRE